MKTPTFLSDCVKVDAWLEQYCDINGGYTISPEGVVSVEGSVAIIENESLTRLKVQFEKVTGSFEIYQCEKLKTLAGTPRHVGGDFLVTQCDALTSLKGGPLTVGGDFNCSDCVQLKSLEGSPLLVEGEYNCYGADITSINGINAIKGHLFFDISTEPNAACMRHLLQNRTPIDGGLEEDEWARVIYDYQATGDILPAVAWFENHYSEPFQGVIVQPIEPGTPDLCQ